MSEFLIQPDIYSSGSHSTLRSLLEDLWIHKIRKGDGTIFIVSGFSNFNGGARFYRHFSEHVEAGGELIAIFGASPSHNMSSRQVVNALLECGARVYLIHRKGIMHAKLYGHYNDNGETLIISSGNFTGPGMSRNIEAALVVDSYLLRSLAASPRKAISSLISGNFLTYQPRLDSQQDVAWQLLYDESRGSTHTPEFEKVTMIITLGHADTARIQAEAGDRASKGTQYFWLSKDAFDFFPALTIKNKRGIKGTLSTIIDLYYCDLGIQDNETRVTFEAENNLDFRLSTGKLKNTKIAKEGDIACLTRVDEYRYELRIIRSIDPSYPELSRNAIHMIGHKGKRYGYIDNLDFQKIIEGQTA